MPSRAHNVREYAEELLEATFFVDISGRRVGYDYVTISKMIRERFPGSRASVRVLRDWYAPALQRKPGVRMPLRRRSRAIMASEFTRSLLLRALDDGRGLAYSTIRWHFYTRFPGIKLLGLRRVEAHLRKQGYVIPVRDAGQ